MSPHATINAWLGSYKTVGEDPKAEAFFMSAGHSRENAQKMAAPGSTVTFIKKDDGHYAQGIEYGGVYKELPFKLGEESSFPARARGEGVMIKQFYEWNDDTSTLHSHVHSTDGFDFDMDFVFAKDFQSATIVRISPTVTSKQEMLRV